MLSHDHWKQKQASLSSQFPETVINQSSINRGSTAYCEQKCNFYSPHCDHRCGRWIIYKSEQYVCTLRITSQNNMYVQYVCDSQMTKNWSLCRLNHKSKVT